MDFNFLFKTQPKVVKLLNNSLKKNRVSQVYLFDGVKGTPKYQAAMYLASLLLCENHNCCGKCLDCRRLEENVHPRLFVVEPTKNELSSTNATIKKEQFEQLEKEFTLSNVEAGTRVFIINDIDKATTSAANSLLKFLEEMPDGCYGILLTENLSSVLNTIKSRSQIVTFEKIDKETLKNIYLSKGIDEETARIICTLTNNSIEGIEYSKSETIKNIITLVKKINQSFFDDANPLLVMQEEGKFLLGLTDKIYHHIFLNLLITITNDRMYYILGKTDEMIFQETIEDMNQYGLDLHQINYNDTFKQVEIMLEYKERLNYNVNLELMYMDMLIRCEV